jgi:hypothetical protein
MKNGKDFIYEYSDLNLFQTRVKILTGKYSGLIFELGSSYLAQAGDKNTFTFNYTIYEIPEKLNKVQLRGNSEFEKHLAYLIVDVINARNNDPKEQEKLHEAATAEGKVWADIPIDDKWYPNKTMVYAKEQPKTTLGGF